MTATLWLSWQDKVSLSESDDGQAVNMVVFTRITRFNRNISAGVDWLKGAPGKVCSVIDVAAADDVAAVSEAWERQFNIDEVAA